MTATEMMAAIERDDTYTGDQQAINCRAMGETAQEIIDQMRAERAYWFPL